MSDTPAAAGSRRAENLQIVAAIDPALAARLRDRQPMLTRPVVEAGCTIDIDLGESRLYGRSAADFAAAQVEAFLAAPTRLAAARPDAGKLMDPHSIALVERLEAAASDVALPGLPEVRGGILFVVGIGLGAHLEPLIASTAPRHVVLVEPIAEFLVHSLDAIDWRAVRARCADSGAALHIVAEETRETCLARLEAAMAGIGETAIDGSHLFVHYTTPAPREIAGHIHRFAGLLTILKGYFDDERLMVENMTANVGARDFRLLDGTRRDPVDVPAIVVGSGPSLDGSIEAIRRCRDHAVIVSAGSALQVLLHHGIVPDWHVEKENTAVSAARLRLILERNRARFPDGRFAGVRLV
ncbi:MAG: 6-hydroxymethylpterin diphosphokinase MptE-like protein, partial [Alphaproteobacteria bacterium]